MKKILSCLLSFLPLVLFAISMFFIFFMEISSLFWETTEPPFWFVFLAVFMVIFTLLMVIAVYAVMIYYIVIACRSPYLDTSMKALWCILLYLLNVLVFPVFWFVVIRKEIEIKESKKFREDIM